jgi:hypothetical protein
MSCTHVCALSWHPQLSPKWPSSKGDFTSAQLKPISRTPGRWTIYATLSVTLNASLTCWLASLILSRGAKARICTISHMRTRMLWHETHRPGPDAYPHTATIFIQVFILVKDVRRCWDSRSKYTWNIVAFCYLRELIKLFNSHKIFLDSLDAADETGRRTTWKSHNHWNWTDPRGYATTDSPSVQTIPKTTNHSPVEARYSRMGRKFSIHARTLSS